MLSACIIQEGDAYFLVVKFNDKFLYRSPITPEFVSFLLLLGIPMCS
ncbi:MULTISPECIES: exosporium protein G [unclassified Bacillus (in: firmicutes)]|nr:MULTISPECIES: exosporium protein G [unclassified Bacillus (in: firmicutes)]SFI28275.1 hypothetical protein SAMN04488574_102217 [Bacillus sp. 71mf]SFS39527.1 hypothetical protein SAMN04488145_101249 [Bacillus sp. 103mf]